MYKRIDIFLSNLENLPNNTLVIDKNVYEILWIMLVKIPHNSKFCIYGTKLMNEANIKNSLNWSNRNNLGNIKDYAS